jgi:HPt (histidine-containing phosphotransfer) domain-containing protein
MDDYLSKPVTADALDEALRRWIPRAARTPPPAPPPARSAPPAVDLGLLQQLRAGEGAGFVGEIIDMFRVDARARLATIRDAAAQRDLASAARAAHALQGSAAHLGAKALASVSGHLEKKVRSGAPFDLEFAVSAIADEVEHVLAALDAEVASAASAAAPTPEKGAP